MAAIIVACAVLLVAVLGCLVVILRIMQNTKAEILNAAYDFFQGGVDSKFTKLVDTSAAIFSARIVTSAAAAIKGSAGGTQKGENFAEMQQNPFVSLIKAKGLGKSPLATAALGMLGQIMADKIKGSQGGSSSAAGGNGQNTFGNIGLK